MVMAVLKAYCRRIFYQVQNFLKGFEALILEVTKPILLSEMQQMKNNKRVICVNANEVSITIDREATCKAPMAVAEAANLAAQVFIMCHPVRSEIVIISHSGPPLLHI